MASSSAASTGFNHLPPGNVAFSQEQLERMMNEYLESQPRHGPPGQGQQQEDFNDSSSFPKNIANSSAPSSSSALLNTKPVLHHRLKVLAKYRKKIASSSVTSSINNSTTKNEEEASYNFRHNFLSWYVLFVEAVGEFSDLKSLINVQLTCRTVFLLMAQNRVFQSYFFRMQPIPNRLLFSTFKRQTSSFTDPSVPVKVWSVGKDYLGAGSKDIDDVPSEENSARTLLTIANNHEDKEQKEISSIPSFYPCQNWKVIARRFENQSQCVAPRVVTPEFFRGIWRIPETNIWKADHLGMIHSPPFFLKPRIVKDQSLVAKEKDNLLRQSKFPSNRIAEVQQFQIILQRSSRNGTNALGVFLQRAGPQLNADQVHQVVFTIAALDRSLSVMNEYKPIHRNSGGVKFTKTQTNSGFILRHNKVTNFNQECNHPNFRAPEWFDSSNHQDDPSWNAEEELENQSKGVSSPEDLVLEIELFSLGIDIVEADDVLSYYDEFGQTLSQNDKMTSQMRGTIWRMIRNLSHTDPYEKGIMSKRKKLLKAILPQLLNDLESDETELYCQSASCLWNLSDVDVPPLTRQELERAVKRVLAKTKQFLCDWSDEKVHQKKTAQELCQEHVSLLASEHVRMADLRRNYLIFAPSMLGCLWNFPQGLDGTISLFCHKPVEIISLMVTIIKLEMRQDELLTLQKERYLEQKRRRSEEGNQSSSSDDEDDDEHFKVVNYRKASTAMLFAACHYLTRAIFYLHNRVDHVTKVLEDFNCETVLQEGVVLLKKITMTMASLGVALFSRDYAIFFIPLLICKNRSSQGCIDFGAFAFEAGYFMPVLDYDIDDEEDY